MAAAMATATASRVSPTRLVVMEALCAQTVRAAVWSVHPLHRPAAVQLGRAMGRASTPVVQVLVLQDVDAKRMDPGRFIALTRLNHLLEDACPTGHVLPATSVLALVSFLAPVYRYVRVGASAGPGGA